MLGNLMPRERMELPHDFFNRFFVEEFNEDVQMCGHETIGKQSQMPLLTEPVKGCERDKGNCFVLEYAHMSSKDGGYEIDSG